MSDDDQEPAPAGEEPEPPPAGEEPEPAPAGEGPEPPPAGEEPEPAPSGESSDSSSDDDSSSEKKSSSSSDDSDSSSSSSDDSDSKGQQSVVLTADDVQSALTAAFQERNVPVGDEEVKVTEEDTGIFHLMVRLSADVKPLPLVPEDTSNLPEGSVQGALYLLQGAVQRLDGAIRVTLRVVSLETGVVLQTGSGDASGTANKDAVQAAAEDALATLDMLHTQ